MGKATICLTFTAPNAPRREGETILLSDKDNVFYERRSEEVLDICAWLGPIMNRVHGTRFSEMFWTRALSSYALAAYNQRDHFNKESFHHPISFQAINGWAPPTRKQILEDLILTFLRSFRGAYSANQLPDVLKDSSRIAFGPRAEIFSSNLGATPLSFNWVPYLGRPDRQVRVSLQTESRNGQTSLYRNICSHVPRLYVEFFGSLLRTFERADSLFIEDVFVEHYGSAFERLFTAYLSEKGASLNQLQQGGFVGETVDSIDLRNRAGYDVLLTYGWVQGPKDRPFYAPRLEEFRARYMADWVKGPPIDVLAVYGSPANSDALVSHYDECTEVLVNRLDRNRYPKILLRPRARSRVLRMTKLPPSFGKVPRDQIDAGHSSIADLCARSRVVVQWTSPATNFLECIFVDQPVVAVDTNQRPTELLIPFLDFFREAGVLHSDSESLVSHLNDVDINSWWQGVTMDRRYIDFKNLFARSKGEWCRARDCGRSRVSKCETERAGTQPE